MEDKNPAKGLAGLLCELTMKSAANRRLWLAAAVLAVAVVSSAILWRKASRPVYLSSPTASRDTAGFRTYGTGVFEPAPRVAPRGRSASAPMAIPKRIEGIDGDFLLDWSDEEPVAAVELPPRWAPGLLDGQKFDLVAFATWTPAADDPLEPDADWSAPARFRDPATLNIFEGAELEELSVPEEWTEFRTPLIGNGVPPQIRLLFRCENMRVRRVVKLQVGDQQTGASLTWPEARIRIESSGEWMRMDVELLAWHDTPIQLEIQVLTGDPEYAELARKPGAEVVFGDRLRLQWLGEFENVVYARERLERFQLPPGADYDSLTHLLQPTSGRPRAAWFNASAKRGRQAVLRASALSFAAEHLGFIAGDEIDWRVESEAANHVNIVRRELIYESTDASPFQLAFVPQKAMLKFDLAGLPDLPNPRGVENLFLAKIPRVPIDSKLNIPIVEMYLHVWIALGAQVGCSSNASELLWTGGAPPSLPSDYQFRNTTPQQLLHWYLRETPGATVRYDEEERVLYFNEPRRSWLDRLGDWWERKKPAWAPF